ncbi:NFACT family protein [Nanoarchaeota archaeon]
MKTEISSLELHFLLKELQQLISAKLEQLYQLENEFIFQFHIPNKGKTFLRVIMGKLLYLASSKPEAPITPPNFCIYLRKRLRSARLRSIEQIAFERVLKLHFETKDNKFNLYLEIFGNGNLILCDENDTILSAREYHEWKDRSLKPKKPYLPPMKDLDFLTLTKDQLHQALIKSDKENLVKTLAIDLSLGGMFAEEICLLSSIDKNVKSRSLTEKETQELYQSTRDILKKELKPFIITKDNSLPEVLPFPLEKHKDQNLELLSSFNQAIDSILTKHEEKKITEVEKKAKTKTDSIQEIINSQNLRIQGLEKSEKENQKKGEFIYENYMDIDAILRNILELREEHSWKEIKSLLKEDSRIKSITEKTGEITLDM